jgi:hypothetical protein
LTYVDARVAIQKGVANGLATLGSDNKIPSAQLPAIAITDTFPVASQAAMLALTAEVGDVAVRTDLGKSFILRVAGASTLTNWQELLTPTDAVLSVNGQTGAVSLTAGGLGALVAANNLSDLTSAATARTNRGLVIGTNVQAYSAEFAALAALSPSNDDVIQRKAGAWSTRSMAQLKTDLALSKSDIGLGSVDNTSVSRSQSAPGFAGLDGHADRTHSLGRHKHDADRDDSVCGRGDSYRGAPRIRGFTHSGPYAVRRKHYCFRGRLSVRYGQLKCAPRCY